MRVYKKQIRPRMSFEDTTLILGLLAEGVASTRHQPDDKVNYWVIEANKIRTRLQKAIRKQT